MNSIDRFDGYLMSKDTILADIRQGKIEEVRNEKLLPIYIARTHNLHHWLKKRAIDSHRTNSRLLKKVLRLQEKDDISTALAVHGVTITDNYWLKPADSDLTWEDVRFKENLFSSLALRGDFSAFNLNPSRTPELTNIGSFEKCWELENGKWWMKKAANEKELFSELFIYHLGAELGFSMAHYEASEGAIRTLDFTSGAQVNYEPAYSWMGDEDNYTKNYEALKPYGEDVLDQFVELILLDTYCLNVDRHTFNYGVLRDVETGEIISMAPNFDNNIALLSNSYVTGFRKPGLMESLLNEFEEETGAVSSYAMRHKLPVITESMIERCIDKTSMNVDREYVRHFVMIGYENTPVPKLAERIQHEHHQELETDLMQIIETAVHREKLNNNSDLEKRKSDFEFEI